MKADAELIRKITNGAVKIEEQAGKLAFQRFTEEQRAVYDDNPPFRNKTYADSGITFEFLTDAKCLRMKGHAATASSRYFYYFDVVVDGVLVGHPGHESCEVDPDFELEAALGDTTRKHVTVYFPCLAQIGLEEFTLDGATFVEPVKRSRRLLCLGDSITQGYDTRYPSLAYTNQLADLLNAEVINKAIGGDRFNPELAALPDAGKFDLIVTGYGTNDWRHHTREKMEHDSREFFVNLRRSYPDVPIVAVLPIWRSNWDLVTEVGTFADAARIIRKAAEGIDGITLVDGTKLTPRLMNFYSDGLHPNEFGFMFYARNLFAEIPEEFK